MPVTITPYIPRYITVHLGAPGQNAENVTVTFPDYIKNVASSEIYPTWGTIRAPGQYFSPGLVRPESGLYRILPQPRLSLSDYLNNCYGSKIYPGQKYF